LQQSCINCSDRPGHCSNISIGERGLDTQLIFAASFFTNSLIGLRRNPVAHIPEFFIEQMLHTLM